METFRKNMRYEILMGLNDSETLQEELAQREVRELLEDFFREEVVNYSLVPATGGYAYRNGTYIRENALLLTVIGMEENNVRRLCCALKMYLNQETVLLEAREIEVLYL